MNSKRLIVCGILSLGLSGLVLSAGCSEPTVTERKGNDEKMIPRDTKIKQPVVGGGTDSEGNKDPKPDNRKPEDKNPSDKNDETPKDKDKKTKDGEKGPDEGKDSGKGKDSDPKKESK